MNVDQNNTNDVFDENERNKQYAIRKINKLIKELQDIIDNKIDEELNLGFFNLSCCLEHWIVESVYMSKVIELKEKKQKRIERYRRLGLSVNEDDYNMSDTN